MIPQVFLQTVSTRLHLGNFEESLPRQIALVACVFLVMLSVTWLVLIRVYGLEAPPAEVYGERGKPARDWLATLTCASVVLCVVQVSLGYSVHSLTLLADVGHSANDTLMYALAFFVEMVKMRFGQMALTRSFVALLDGVSAIFSVFVVTSTTALAVMTAIERLRQHPLEQTDQGTVGMALIFFSSLTLVVGVGMLYLHAQWSTGTARSTGEGHPLLAETDCLPCEAEGMRPMDILHTIFHPGCDNQCMVTKGETGAADLNLNMYGVLLHLTTDVLRTFVMLVAGLLAISGTVSNRLDSVASLVVGGCVLLGSLALVFVTCQRFYRFWCETSI